MEQLVNDIFGSWAGVVHKILNWIGCNVKKAANADDTAQKKA